MTTAARLGAWARSPEGLLCLGLWILYGILINAYDLESFNLQQMGIEAIVERGHLFVDGSPTPRLQPGGDVFLHDGHLYAAKQPGQFFAGALVYAALHALGLSYLSNFLVTAALVTFFTASLATAVAAVCVYRLGRAWAAPAASPLWPWLAALAFGVCSTALPYAGVTHHDVLATSYLTAAFAILWLAELRPPTIALIGLLLGWTITTSMLPAPMVAVTLLGALAGHPRRTPWMALGVAAGIAPLLAYNWVSFGHPLLVPNVAGQFADTFFFFDWSNLTGKVAFYARMATLYAPILWCGLIGLACFPARVHRPQLAAAALIAALLAYVCNIETLGGCQYGPRYLLPAMPFLALGLVGFSHIAQPNRRRMAAAVVVAVAALSAIINAVGALYGAMYCDLARYGFTHYLAAMRLGIVRAFPLALWLAVPLALWAIAVAAAFRGAAGRAAAADSVDAIETPVSRARIGSLWLLAGSVLYACALIAWRDAVPQGLNNDAAEETLRGLDLLASHRLQVFSSSPGIPQETLYLYGVAAVARLLGTTTLAIQLASWAVALACVWMLARMAQRIDEELPIWAPLLVALSSLWLFHYARSGLRAISAPFFCLAIARLLDGAERGAARRAAALACGALLGLSLYAYTACRVLPLAFLAHAALRLWRCRGDRRPLWRSYASVAGAALVVSIPNLLVLASTPQAFLWRGSYVLPPAAEVPRAVLWSALVPFARDPSYRTLVGPAHIFDGVSAAFTTAGLRPLHAVLAALLLIGLLPAWRRRARPALSFLFFVWLLGTLGLGVAGPSLTRLLIVLPALLVTAALGAGWLAERRPRLAPLLAAALLLLLLAEYYRYFTTFAQTPEAQAYYSPAATPIGRRARALAATGQRVVAVVSKDANVVTYLTYDQAPAVRVVEFYRRALEPREIPIGEFQPRVLLVERVPRFARFAGLFPTARHVGAEPEYDEIRLD